jgi:hypothetical protein
VAEVENLVSGLYGKLARRHRGAERR